MTKQPAVFPKYSPGVLSLIPLFYVGWADSVLSPSEMELIHSTVKDLKFLSVEDKELIIEWTNPAKPPSPALFKHWVALIKKSSADLPIDKRQSLADLGLQMAKQSDQFDSEERWQTSDTQNAINQLEEMLGIDTIENFRNILSPHLRDNEIKENIEKASFNIDAMTAFLDDDYSETRNKMRTILSDPIFKLETIRDKDEYRNKVKEWCQHLANQGLGAWSYPSEYGGHNNIGEYTAIFEMIGYHDNSLAIKFGVQFGLFGGSILGLGTKKHYDKYLKDTGTMDLLGCFAMTETGHGSNVRGLETTATYNHADRTIIVNTPNDDAGKEYIGNALHGEMASVFAQLIVNGENQGVHAVLVPLKDKQGKYYDGIRVADCGYKLGLNGVDNGRIWFDNVKVPVDNLLNKFGDINEAGEYTSPIESVSRRFFTMLGTLVGGRVAVPRAGLSAAKSGLAIAIKHSLKRRQFGPNDKEPETLLLDYPTHQRRLMPLLAKSYALDVSLTGLAKMYDNHSEENIREIETLAAGLKSYSTWFTTKALQECREACGGKGYLAENRFADLKADTDIFTTFEGDNTVLMQLVAKALLSDFQKSFHNEGFRAVFRYLTTQVSSTATEWNPMYTRNTDVEHLLDPEFQMGAFEMRTTKLLHTVSQRMRKLLGQKLDAYNAFLKCQTHLVTLAEAYVEQHVLRTFVEAINKTSDPNLKKVLKKLCDLYALHTIELHKGWYLEHDYMQGSKTKAIRRVVNKLCKEVRNEATFLVDAFAIPKACLSAPIAM